MSFSLLADETVARLTDEAPKPVKLSLGGFMRRSNCPLALKTLYNNRGSLAWLSHTDSEGRHSGKLWVDVEGAVGWFRQRGWRLEISN